MVPYNVEMPADVTQAVGQLIAQWSHLDEAISSHVRILLGQPEAKKITNFPDHLRISLDRRIAIYRDLATALFNDEERERATKALDKVCNLRVSREHIIHGGITPQEDGRLLINFVTERPDGSLSGENHWYTVDKIENITRQMAEAEGSLSESFRSYFARKKR